MTGLVDWAVARARMIFALIFLSVGAGLLAYVTLPKEGAPDIDVPVLYVSVALHGASAADAERLLVKPLETELNQVEGLKEMTAYAVDGHASVLLEFNFDWDKGATLADVRDRVDRAQAEMPNEVEQPTVQEINMSEFPILVVSLSGVAPERTLMRVAKDLQRDIEGLGSVLEAGLAGVRDEMVEVLIDPLKLEATGVTADELATVVTSNNQLVAAGELETGAGAFPIRVPGAFESQDEVLDLPIKVSGDRMVLLRDVATIRRTFVDATGTARFNGQPTVALQIKKRVGMNLLDTVAEVRATVEAAQADWPDPLRQALTISYSMDESLRVNDMIDQLEGAVMTAVALVMLVVVLTLGTRSALLVGLAVPCSFLLTFALFGAMGLSVSNMAMFGLILSVGILVDGAIVVAEFADKRLSAGDAPSEAYANAARRMFWPIVSSTATTLCAFLPMLFWPGLAGEFMSLLPITIIVVLSASLLVALIYLPVVGAALGSIAAALGRLVPKSIRTWRAGRAAKGAAPFAPRRRKLFGRVIQLVAGNPVMPFVTIALAVVAVVGAMNAYGTYGKGAEFFVETEPERANLYVRARGNLSLGERDRLVREIEMRVVGLPGVESVFAFAGEAGLESAQGGEGPPDAIGQVQLELAPWRQRLLGPDADVLGGETVLEAAMAAIGDTPGVYVELLRLEEGPENGKPIQLELVSADRAALAEATEIARRTFEATPELTDVDDTRPLPGVEWRYEIDRAQAVRFGADVSQAGTMIQFATRGALLGAFRPDDADDEVDIRVRFPERYRNLSTLTGLRIATERGMVSLSSFVELTPAPKVAEIARRDGARFFMVRANTVEGVLPNDKILKLQEWLDTDPFPRGVDAKFVGDFEEQAETTAFLGQAFLGALGLMFVILLAQFNSIYNAVLVLSAVVMSIAGVLIGMLVMDQTFSIIMTGTGVVALAGIVVNNNIVLIDTYQEYAKRMPRLEAIVRTAEDRLRPVVLTTATTMAGLAPMMFATSIDFANASLIVGAPTALWWVPLSTAVVFGLGFATILTLFVTPAALAARVWAQGGALRLGSFLRERLGGVFVANWAEGRTARDRALARKLADARAELIWTDDDAASRRRDGMDLAAE